MLGNTNDKDMQKCESLLIIKKNNNKIVLAEE